MTRFPFIAAVGLTLALALPAQAESLGDGWTFRRPLIFRQTPSDAPGDNIAWAEFYANGTQQPDGSDIRITTADHFILPFKILQVSRDNDLVRVAFATHGDGPYFVWWGNPKAEKPAKELDIRRGIFLEISRNNAPGPAALNAAPGPVMASFMLPEVDLGFNPFGEERQVRLHYSGQFKIDRAVSANLAFTVNDMGILTIDGKEVERQSGGGLRGQVRNSVSLTLTAGWHTLDVVQVNHNQPNVILAVAWQRSGEKGFSPLPAAMFAPAAHALPGNLEKAGGGAVPDISVEPAAEGFFPPMYYASRYILEARFPASMSPVTHWDLGDGQLVTGLKTVNHMFLSPGDYRVTLKLGNSSNGQEGPATTLRLGVRDRLYEKFPRPPEDPAPAIRTLLRGYKPELLPSEQAFRGMLFFEEANDDDNQIIWGKAWLAGKDRVALSDAVVFDETFALARLQIAKKQFQDAAESFKRAAAKPMGMEMRANLMRHEVMTLCDYVNDAAAATTEAQSWLKRINTASRPQVQAVQGALAYALIAASDGKGAQAAVEAAVASGGGVVARGGDAYNQQQIRQGVMTRNVENYIRTKDLDTAWTLLNQWELEFPDAIWEGFTRTLRVKLAAAEGRNLVAARIALAHARANPEGFYAAELLYRAAENFKLAGEQQQARTVLDLLAGKYPESPYARQAQSK